MFEMIFHGAARQGEPLGLMLALFKLRDPFFERI
jgi:hypothetical protein